MPPRLSRSSRLHDRDYVDFLVELSWKIKPEHEYLPAIFHDDLGDAPIWFRGGAYCRETGTPIGPHTIDAAFNSAATALAAAAHVLTTGEDALALCRPPGHHAGKRRYGGYSFFNNAYLAAAQIRAAGRHSAVLDIDYHIGDGSLEFASADAPYFSLHAHPGRNYPYLASLADADLPHATLTVLAPGVTVDQYLDQLSGLIAGVAAARPDVVILSLGFDTLGIDYIQDEETAIAADDFARIGEAVAGLPAPLLIILEGGYDPDHLTRCTERFFSGFNDMRRR